VVVLDDKERHDEDASRARELLARVRGRCGEKRFARVESVNHFPTASGLASSASGFAALAAASCRAYGVDASLSELSAMARRSSASAARSLYPGFVELPAGVPGDDALAASPLAPADHWDIAVVIALASRSRKKTSSRDGMVETARTSPYYPAWLAVAPRYAHDVREGILARDLERVGRAMEASTFAMHASAWAAVPAVRYFAPATATLLDCVDELRGRGVGAWATMDAGPHVKVFCMATDAETVREALASTGGAVDVRIARPGPGIT
jgi:diphosphomevalonate decarboxylase